MKCQACDKNINDWESTHKHHETNEYTDMCAKCLNQVVQTTKELEYNHDVLYEFEPEETQERPSNFDYYEEDWDKYD